MDYLAIKPHFNLRKATSDKPQLLYLVCFIDGKQIKISTAQKVLPKYWCNSKSVAIISNIQSKAIQLHNKQVNNALHSILGVFNNFIDYLADHPDCNKISTFNQFFKSNKKLSVIDLMIDSVNSMDAKSLTKKKYLYDIDSFGKFLNSINLTELNKITSNVLKRYEIYLKDCNIKDTTIKNKISVLLIIFNNLGYSVDNYKLPKAKKELFEVYLTDIEITTIYNTQFKGSMEYSKDLFVLQCQLGQRYSDMDLSKAIINKDTIELIQLKTNTRVIIPLTQIAKDILCKYSTFHLPDKNTYNRHIKQIAKECGINAICLKDNQKVPKYELLSSHSARRTFITNALKRGLSDSVVMKISGHKSRSAFDRYVKLNALDVSEVFNSSIQI